MNTKLFIFSLMVLGLVSCTKEEDAIEVVNGSAKVTGFVEADLDLTTSGLEFAPAGTKIIAIINTEDLIANPDPNVNYPNKTYTTTVGANGIYTLNIDANAKNVNVTIVANDFEYNRILNDTTIERKIYHCNGTTTSVIDQSNKIIDLNYF